MPRAVLDTSVLISATLNRDGAPAEVLRAHRRGAFHLVLSEPILAEYREVIARPRLARILARSGEQVRVVTALLAATPVLLELGPIPPIGRDPRDAMLVATARAGAAEVIVSRDEDVTRDEEVARFCHEHGIETLTVRQFLARLVAADTPLEPGQ